MNGEPLQILLVEDDDDHAEVVFRALQGNRVVDGMHRLPDGEAALDYLFRQGPYADASLSPRPNLILLDLRLPKVDGLDVLRRVKESVVLRSIPVVILTTSQAELDVASAYGLHANSYLVKSVDFSKFAEMMNALGNYWLEWNRSPLERGER